MFVENRASSRHFSLCLPLFTLIGGRCEVQRAEAFLGGLDGRAEVYKHERFAFSRETIFENHCEFAVSEVYMGTVVSNVDKHIAQRAQRAVDELGLLQRLALRVRLVQSLTACEIHQIQPSINHAVLRSILSINISAFHSCVSFLQCEYHMAPRGLVVHIGALHLTVSLSVPTPTARHADATSISR